MTDRLRAVLSACLKLIGLLAFTWLFVWPLVMLLLGAFRSSPLSPRQEWTLSGFQRLVQDPLLTALENWAVSAVEE